MARPELQGLKYFPLDVGFYRDKKVRLLRGEHNAEGIEIYQRLVCKCYEDNGYFLEWNSDEDNALLAEETGYPIDKIRLVVSSCLKWSLFDDTLFKVGNVLSSRGIQRRYFSAIKDTKIKAAAQGRYKTIDKNMCLLTDADLSELNEKHVWLKVVQNHGFSGNNDDKSEINPNKSGINSAKEIKGNKNKVNKSKEKNYAPPDGVSLADLRQRYTPEQLKIIDEFFDVLRYTRKGGKLADSVVLRIYQDWAKHEVQKVLYALNLYIKNPALHSKDERYVLGIIRRVTADEIDKYKSQLNAEGKYGRSKPAKHNKFANYRQRDWDYDKLEQLEQEFMLEGLGVKPEKER